MQTPHNINKLYKNVREVIHEARSAVSKTLNFVTVIQNWEIGRLIVEDEQGGKAKAEYDKSIISDLSKRLIAEFGKGFAFVARQKYASKYKLYLPSEEELCKELEQQKQQIELEIK